MTMPHSALLDSDQKQIVRECIFMYVQDIQGKYYRDKTISASDYEAQMQKISEIIEVLHLKNVYA